MSTSSLSSIKKDFGITDDFSVKYEKKGDKLILHIPLRLSYSENKEIINQAHNMVQQQEKNGWSREDFFSDFMKVREKVLREVRD